jgi:hypothetical protein
MPATSPDDEIRNLLYVQASRIRNGKPALVGIDNERIRKCKAHGLHNAWFTVEGEERPICLWCATEEERDS